MPQVNPYTNDVLLIVNNPIQVKKHFTCSRLQCLTTFYLFKTASASHGGIKRKASAGTLVLILSEAARIFECYHWQHFKSIHCQIFKNAMYN